ncbi:DUF1788 domain-containing protein [uncultured Methanobrevibacter sp.]|uniref:DUF1788 domain-containing protein n=1 Tax=Methanobrevibacter smithii TaxID=2173 RepID=UPI0025CC11AE|nr:DUF1788 domain-containing protein [uncultured Methanobrevibacter sp.]
MNFEERLSNVELKIKDPSLKADYYIFDYDPKYEIKIRNEVKYLKEKINNSTMGINIIEFDLYEIILDILKSKGYLEKTFEFEKKKGRNLAKKAVTKMLKLSMDSNLIVQYIKERYSPDSIIFITGVGKAYPLLRSHNVLNNLSQQIDDVPVIMFFPGKYSGLDLLLFNTIKDSNFYKAEPLIK